MAHDVPLGCAPDEYDDLVRTFPNEYSGHADKLLAIFLSKSVECIPIPDKKELVMTVTNQFAAHVGLDWADKKHDVCVQFKNGERVFGDAANLLI
ncbi:hypothetical protein KDU73_00960 [Klebsiella michiganensis]|nr:hypothetical protein KDU73_00960 [Klebsiella michiganensis]